MEAVSQVRSVAPKFRCVAGGLVAIMLICTVLQLIKDIVFIFKERHHPPTTITFVNAANGDVDFGPMPWIAFKLESFGEDFGPQFTKSKTSFDILGDKYLWKKFTCSPPSELVCPLPNVSVVTTTLVDKPSQNNLAIFDMTHVQPQWSDNTPSVKVILHSNTTRPTLTFYSGDAKQLAVARATQDFDSLEGRFQGHAVGKLSESKPGCIRMYIEMEKDFVPWIGTCWGFPWQDECTQVHYTMVTSAFSHDEPVSDDCESGQIKIQIIVRSFMVRTVTPVSMFDQLQSAMIQSFGGSLALMTSVFLFLFVRQYPSTNNEIMNTALTLRGTEEDERPTFDEYEEMESAPMEPEAESE